MATSMNPTMFRSKLCSLCLSRPYLCKKIVRRTLRFSAVHNAETQPTPNQISPENIQLDPVLRQRLEKNELKHRVHPGVMKLKAVSLPTQLEKAVHIMLEKYPVQHVVKNAEKFSRYLKCRHIPLEDKDLKNKAIHIEEKVRQKEAGYGSVDDMDSDKRQQLESKVKGRVLRQLRQQVYHWMPVDYTAYKGFLYMVGKMDHDYAALLRCLNEIRSRVPDFIPRTVFDFGSGVGSVVWGVDTVWKGDVAEYYCVDSSGEMNTLARLLLQDGEDNKKMCLPGVNFRQFHPSTQHKFDMTVSTFTLFEFPSKAERLMALRDLWAMTGEFMVLIENNSTAGFELIQEAREYILKLTADGTEGHVFAPCPHDQKCPKLSWKKNTACVFEVKFNKLQMSTNTTVCDTSRFSYVILRKGKRRSDVANWPRLVKRSSKPRNHTPCTICCPNGNIKSVVITTSKHSKDLYKCSRYCHLGDLLPVNIKLTEEEARIDSCHGNMTEAGLEDIAEDSGSDCDKGTNELHPENTLTPS